MLLVAMWTSAGISLGSVMSTFSLTEHVMDIIAVERCIHLLSFGLVHLSFSTIATWETINISKQLSLTITFHINSVSKN